MNRKNAITYLAVILIFFILFASSCYGPTGPDGQDAILSDSLAPVIEWIYPSPGQFNVDTLVLRARVIDDQQIWKVIFYTGGFDHQTVILDSTEGIYEYAWPLYLYPTGPYPIMARAWDISRNVAVTPVFIIEKVDN